MKTQDLFHETFAALLSNKARSGLTVLGIVIGIGSVIAMIAIGQGAQNSISASIESLGSNLLTILPGVVQPGRGIVSSGRGSSQSLKNADIEVIQGVDGVAAVAPEVSRRYQVTSETGNNTNTTITGTTAVYQTVRNLEIATGNFITDSDERSLGRTAILGATVATDLFADLDPLGKHIRINKTDFRVIGTLAKKGGAGFSGPDDMIIVPRSTMQKILSGNDSLSTVYVSVTNKNQMNDVRDAISSALLDKHHVADPDFSIISQEDILGTLSTITTTLTIFLSSIASISLLVGGIGIMNMMLTTVTERTREIGLRKAVGATRKDITTQFLAEAIALTFVGGFVGILLGALIAFGVKQIAGIAASVSIPSVFLAFGVSAAIGIIFGYYPARRAAKMNPIQALRYE